MPLLRRTKTKYSNGQEKSCVFYKDKSEWAYLPCKADNSLFAKEQTKKSLLEKEK